MHPTGHRSGTPERQVGSGMVAHAYNPGAEESPQAKTSLNYIAKPCVIKQPTQQTQTSIQKQAKKKSDGSGRNGRRKTFTPKKPEVSMTQEMHLTGS